MSHPAIATSAPTPHQCPRCARRYVVVPGRSIASPPLCACGAALATSSLSGGVYELQRSRRASRRRAPRASAPAQPPAPPSTNKTPEDNGYGESHGYGPAHGGPTGPGDAPAPEPLPTNDPE